MRLPDAMAQLIIAKNRGDRAQLRTLGMQPVQQLLAPPVGNDECSASGQ
jgi:hypothetical protein